MDNPALGLDRCGVAGKVKRNKPERDNSSNDTAQDEAGAQGYRRLALMWIEAVYLQIERVEAAVDLLHELQLARQFVDAWRAGRRDAAWRNEYRKAMRVLARRKAMTARDSRASRPSWFDHTRMAVLSCPAEAVTSTSSSWAGRRSA